MVARANPPKGLVPAEREAIVRACAKLYHERRKLPWWAWRRWNEINREMRALLDSLGDES